MSEALSESAIVRAVAHQTSRRIIRKVIAGLQRIKDTLSGDDSELKTTWDEICAQVQYEHSIFWETYDEIVRDMVRVYVAELPKHEREAIWLQTDAGSDWHCEEPEDRAAHPVVDDDVVDYLVHEYVYPQAGRWSNVRIRDYIERSGMRD
jgi:hypothetical protein